MSDISIMVLPTQPEDPDSTPQIYMHRRGAWRVIPPVGRAGMKEIREGIEQILGYVMSEIEAGRPTGALSALRDQFGSQWEELVPSQLRQHITNTLTAAQSPPRFLINSHPMLEWLPWELLHDGVDWLSLRCRIARLPIVDKGPEQLDAEQHTVQRVASFLGARVFQEPHTSDPAYATWSELFSGHEQYGVQVARWPSNGGSGWPTVDDFARSAKCDIIHVTCHSGVDTIPGPYLALDGTGWMSGGVTSKLAARLPFPTPGPLVFGNACGVVQSSQQRGPAVTRGLGVAFYNTGTSAYIGAIAKITRAVALEFAERFYGFLLGDGEPVGEALRHTKQTFAESGEQDPSWLFYCLYGSPDMRFVLQ